jgi:hypothetical protein
MAQRQVPNVVSYGIWDPTVVPYGGRFPGPLPRQLRAPTIGAKLYRHTTRCLTGPNFLTPYHTTAGV